MQKDHPVIMYKEDFVSEDYGKSIPSFKALSFIIDSFSYHEGPIDNIITLETSLKILILNLNDP